MGTTAEAGEQNLVCPEEGNCAFCFTGTEDTFLCYILPIEAGEAATIPVQPPEIIDLNETEEKKVIKWM